MFRCINPSPFLSLKICGFRQTVGSAESFVILDGFVTESCRGTEIRFELFTGGLCLKGAGNLAVVLIGMY